MVPKELPRSPSLLGSGSSWLKPEPGQGERPSSETERSAFRTPPPRSWSFKLLDLVRLSEFREAHTSRKTLNRCREKAGEGYGSPPLQDL